MTERAEWSRNLTVDSYEGLRPGRNVRPQRCKVGHPVTQIGGQGCHQGGGCKEGETEAEA